MDICIPGVTFIAIFILILVIISVVWGIVFLISKKKHSNILLYKASKIYIVSLKYYFYAFVFLVFGLVAPFLFKFTYEPYFLCAEELDFIAVLVATIVSIVKGVKIYKTELNLLPKDSYITNSKSIAGLILIIFVSIFFFYFL